MPVERETLSSFWQSANAYEPIPIRFFVKVTLVSFALSLKELSPTAVILSPAVYDVAALPPGYLIIVLPALFISSPFEPAENAVLFSSAVRELQPLKAEAETELTEAVILNIVMPLPLNASAPMFLTSLPSFTDFSAEE